MFAVQATNGKFVKVSWHLGKPEKVTFSAKPKVFKAKKDAQLIARELKTYAAWAEKWYVDNVQADRVKEYAKKGAKWKMIRTCGMKVVELGLETIYSGSRLD
jgi:hypothetical protein